MRNHNARNERIKRKYYTWLKEARGQSEATIDQVSSSIDRFDAYAKHADFASFHVEKVKAFKADLADQVEPHQASIEPCDSLRNLKCVAIVLRMAVGTTRLQTVVCVR
jgi:hypothetical protein